MLVDIANKAQDSSVDLHISIFVTCLCDPESIPTIPNSVISIEKPKIANLVKPFLSSEGGIEAGKTGKGRNGGGFAIAVSGPARLTAEAQNVVARIPAAAARRIGGLAFHSEIFSL